MRGSRYREGLAGAWPGRLSVRGTGLHAKSAAKRAGVLGSALPIGNGLRSYFDRRRNFLPNWYKMIAVRDLGISLIP
jgi:hypothetical protein